VTALGTRPGTRAVPADPAEPVGPVPRRVRPPRWLDLRLVLGVLLVLGSVLLGARVVAGADRTVPVWAAAGDLAAGTVLTADDLVPVDVRLDDASGAYLSTSTQPPGRTLSRAVRRGELLPRSALDATSAQVQLALPVQAGYVPPGLGRGSRVDVYALPAATGQAGPATEPAVVAVVRDATVQAVSGRSQGVLSTPTTTVQVVVSVPGDVAPGVLAAVGGHALAVVLHDGVDTGTSGPTG
jgi:SAF domain